MKIFIYIVILIIANSFLAYAQFEGEYYDGSSTIRLTIVDADTTVTISKASYLGDGANYIKFFLPGADSSIIHSNWQFDGAAFSIFKLPMSDTVISYNNSNWLADGHSSIIFDTLFIYTLETPLNLRAIMIEKQKIVLKWDEIIGADNYRLFRSFQPEGPYIQVYSGQNIECEDAGGHLKPFTNYYYRVIAENIFGNSPFSDILQVKTLPEIHSLPLAIGWNMISTYIETENTDMEEVFSEIKNSTVIVKNNAGQIFYPEFEINDIGEWDVKQGYQVYMSKSETLSISGMKIVPETTQIALNAGWNMIAYLRSNPMDIEIALASIVASDNLVIAKDNFGNVFYPAFEINIIGDMLSGQGYQIFILNDDLLVYPEN
ncbi:MAG: fibronectin type III domain-containing protein [Desulfobulbaceae bacterium]|nr:fibronectin type III domain-containing protein [Desulfobulbaceae bacterium]